MGVAEETGKVAVSAVEAFRTQPGLLFLTLVNLGFLVFIYFLGTLVLDAYSEQQRQIHERFQSAIRLIDSCVLGEAQQRRGPPENVINRGATPSR